MIKIYNDINELYNQPVLETRNGWMCPVCEKEYKRRTFLNKHLESKKCHSIVDVFKNTETEMFGLEAYQFIQEEHTFIRKINSLSQFRRSKLYKPIMESIVFWSQNKGSMHQFKFYILWCTRLVRSNTDLYKAIYSSKQEKNLKEFRLFLQRKTPHVIDSERFHNINKDKLLNDNWFLLRSIERADISLEYAIQNMGMDRFDSFEHPLKVRLDLYISEVLNDK